jgi:DNA primase large subunit
LSIPTELVNHYPWLPSLKKYYSEIASKSPSIFISEIISQDLGSELKERILSLFEAAFENLEEISGYRSDKLNVYVYLLLNIILHSLDNQLITNRVANLYSKINYNELINENSDANLYNICKDIGLDIRYYDPPINYGVNIVKDQHQKLKTNFTIHYIDYLNLASNLRDEYRKLVHNPLLEGYVFIQDYNLIRLIQEYVRNRLLIKESDDKYSTKSLLKEVTKIQDFKEIIDKILEAWEERKEEFEFNFKIDFESEEDVVNLFPPCVNEILKKMQAGQNLIHNERLFIVWFLLALEYPVEKVVDLFSTMPDFDREKTTYQVNFAQKKKYIPYKCLTLKSLNSCLAVKYKDELCLGGYGSVEPSERKKIKHPLAYTKTKQYRASKTKFYKKKESSRKNE